MMKICSFLTMIFHVIYLYKSFDYTTFLHFLKAYMFHSPYLIGIKGAGMVGLATLLHKKGIPIKGSDVKERFFSDEILEKIGIQAENFKSEIPENCDAVIYSAAYKEDHPQREEAKARNIPQYSYFETVGRFAKTKETISVIGTHGKTTTTAMLGYLLKHLAISPTVLVGSRVKDFNNTTVLHGNSNFFVVEACEYKNHFFHLPPQYSLCTNIDYDHVDFFKTKEDYRKSFIKYLENINNKNLISHISCNLKKGITYGEENSNADITFAMKKREGQYQCVEISLAGKILEYKLPLFGTHMVSNFTGALAMAWKIVDGTRDKGRGTSLDSFYEKTYQAMMGFSGITRRMESYGEYNGALLFDDYAHHPKELETTIAGIKEAFPNKKLHIIFQSHTFSRTKNLKIEFAKSLKKADFLYIAPIYASAREKENYSNEEFLEEIKKEKNNVFYGSFEEISTNIKNKISHLDVVCTMGAGDVWKVLNTLTN